MTDPTREHTRRILEHLERQADEADERIAELETQGHRIVDGGPSGDWRTDAEGRDVCDWTTLDWRTGQFLITLTGTSDDFDRAMEQADPDGRWWHIDAVHEGVYDGPPVVTAGVPASLSEAVADWIGSRATSDEDVAEWASWPIDRVKSARES